MLRIAVSPLVAAVAFGLLNPAALDVEDDDRAPVAQGDDADPSVDAGEPPPASE
jgi:hypothetical protein